MSDVKTFIGASLDLAKPKTDWETPTLKCMSILVGLNGDRRWREVSDLICGPRVRGRPQIRFNAAPWMKPYLLLVSARERSSPSSRNYQPDRSYASWRGYPDRRTSPPGSWEAWRCWALT